MFEFIAVTNRRLCEGDFWTRLGAVAASGVSAVILREKNLPSAEYEKMFSRALGICEDWGVPLFSHGFADAAVLRAAAGIHLPFSAVAALSEDCDTSAFKYMPRGARTGVSVHSALEARRAVALGASYLVAGHIFKTESKAGLAPRGMDFLSEICALAPIPVYAIGGVSERNIADVRRAGAAGACLMSSLMICADPAAYISCLRSNSEI
ncbi:MAG: thiamine phosphate synthase [Clostridiales Family XIII bacterium]|jgi:thiamine-phosphate pyrophosphorylase|nr:thiamine phosphate synthase [Clostridiales Family XIII bacterium]